MPDQTPEVCATCGRPQLRSSDRHHDAPYTPDCESSGCHPFRPAEPTPEVCAEVVVTSPRADWLCELPKGHGGDHRATNPAFRPAEPTPAERPEGGEWERIGELTPGFIHWRSDAYALAIPGSIERAISSAAVAEAEATVGKWKMYVARAGRNAAVQYQRAEAAERALEEAREALRYLALSVSHGGECPSCGGDPMFWLSNKSGHAPQCALIKADQALTRALVSTESEATS